MTTLLESPTLLRRRSKTLRIAFVTTTVSGVAYYRMASFAWKMRSWPGVQTHVWPYSKNTTIQNPWELDMLSNEPLIFVKALGNHVSVRQYLDWLCETSDVVVWQELHFPHSLEMWEDLRLRHQKPFLMEIDDYCWDVPVGNEAFEQFQPGTTRSRVIRQQLQNSDGLIVSTPYLAKQYEGINDRIYVVPNSIDFDEWDGQKRRSGKDRVRIGWIGGGTHTPDLEMVRPAIEQVLKKYENAWFYCIHGVPNSYKTMKHVYWTHKWATINLYPRFLASYKFDIGIAPLVDNNFNRGKSNLRWLEYSALKIPTVASPLPDFTRVIKNGNGIIANDNDQWVKSLSYLIEDSVSRETIGKNAYKTIKKDFNAYKTASQYLKLLRNIANG